MDCKYFEEQLSAYLDHELDSEQYAQVEKHLNECAACRKKAEDWKQLQQLLQTARPQAPDFVTPAMKKIEKGSAKPRVARRWITAVCAAAACLMLAVMLPMMRPQTAMDTAYEFKSEKGYSVEEACMEDAVCEAEIVTEERESDSEPTGGAQEVPQLQVKDVQAIVDTLQLELGCEAKLRVVQTQQGYLLKNIAEYREILESALEQQDVLLPAQVWTVGQVEITE